VLEQLVAIALLHRVDAVLPERRTVMAARRDHLLAALARALPDWSATRPTGGLSLWVDLGAPRSSVLVEAAARHGLHLAAGPRFGTGGAFEGFLRVPYTHPVDVLDDAVARLAAAWETADGGAPAMLSPVV
jgi:DNA-binding transcriptional MocR family regulator